MARNFYWEMVFIPTLSEKRPAIKNQFQMKFSQINKTLLDYFKQRCVIALKKGQITIRNTITN